SVANGKIPFETPFRELYIPPAAGDAGTAIGAALWVWHGVLGRPRRFRLDHAGLGPAPSSEAIQGALAKAGLSYEWCDDPEVLVRRSAELIEAGNVMGWFRGPAEWGPRALGHRSILADPRRADMRETLNARVKRRESFRPFAPIVPESAYADYFAAPHPVPFMNQVYPVRPARR